MCCIGEEINQVSGNRSEIAESGLERKKMQPARFPLIFSLVGSQKVRTVPEYRVRRLLDTESPGLPHRSPLVFWPIIAIFRRKYLEYFLIHFCG